MKIGFMGPKGTFSQKAAIEYKNLQNGDVELVSFRTIIDVLVAVQSGKNRQWGSTN